jgi:hypothetical protein
VWATQATAQGGPRRAVSAGACLRLGCPASAGGGSGWAIALSCGEGGRAEDGRDASGERQTPDVAAGSPRPHTPTPQTRHIWRRLSPRTRRHAHSPTQRRSLGAHNVHPAAPRTGGLPRWLSTVHTADAAPERQPDTQHEMRRCSARLRCSGYSSPAPSTPLHLSPWALTMLNEHLGHARAPPAHERRSQSRARPHRGMDLGRVHGHLPAQGRVISFGEGSQRGGPRWIFARVCPACSRQTWSRDTPSQAFARVRCSLRHLEA